MTSGDRRVDAHLFVDPPHAGQQHSTTINLEVGKCVGPLHRAPPLLFLRGLPSAVFGLAAANDKIPGNPAKGIRLAKPKVEKKSRVPFDTADLHRIFCSPVFS